MSRRPVLGLDIGGANLKAAHSAGWACTLPFALWKHPHDLADALARLLQASPPFERLAVTMTGELCDCFATKTEGVRHILDAAAHASTVEPLIWTTAGRFVSLAEAHRDALAPAAANWLALAVFVGRFVPHGRAILIDIGSTTTDIIPLQDGQPVPRGRTDPQRLQSGELVYTGVRRSPACALLSDGFAAEFFATAHDAYLLLGEVSEAPEDRDTADGRPATCDDAHARLARMLGGDGPSVSRSETRAVALQMRQCQLDRIRTGLRRVRERNGEPDRYVVSGSGAFLARAVVGEKTIVDCAEHLGPTVSTAACAYAVAVLAAERAS